MILSIASGKGGTGKTTVAASLAFVTENSVYLDCDVEEPNGHIFLNPNYLSETPSQKNLPVIDTSKCTMCNKCVEVCEFNALLNLKTEIMLIPELCHSCGACSYFCPENIISEREETVGYVREGFSSIKDIRFIDGILNVGQQTPVSLIKDVKKRVKRDKINFIDAPPGTSCSMVEAIRESHFCILVTEPTPFGLHDLKLAVDVLRILGIPFGVVINKYDKLFNEMDRYLEKEKIFLIGKIPFQKEIAGNYSKGKLPVMISDEMRELFQNLSERILIHSTNGFTKI